MIKLLFHLIKNVENRINSRFSFLSIKLWDCGFLLEHKSLSLFLFFFYFFLSPRHILFNFFSCHFLGHPTFFEISIFFLFFYSFLAPRHILFNFFRRHFLENQTFFEISMLIWSKKKAFCLSNGLKCYENHQQILLLEFKLILNY